MVAILLTTWIFGSFLLLITILAYAALEDHFPRLFAKLWGEPEPGAFDWDDAEWQMGEVIDIDFDRADGGSLA